MELYFKKFLLLVVSSCIILCWIKSFIKNRPFPNTFVMMPKVCSKVLVFFLTAIFLNVPLNITFKKALRSITAFEITARSLAKVEALLSEISWHFYVFEMTRNVGLTSLAKTSV